MRLLTLLTTAAIAAVSHGAFAQTIDDLTVGTRVRIRAFDDIRQRDQTYEADVVTHDSTRVVIRRDPAAHDTLPFFTIKSLEMQRGHTTHTKTVAIGALTGALVGGVMVLASHLAPINPDDPSSDNRKLRKVALASVPAFAAVGITLGMIADTNLWVSVRFPSNGSGETGR